MISSGFFLQNELYIQDSPPTSRLIHVSRRHVFSLGMFFDSLLGRVSFLQSDVIFKIIYDTGRPKYPVVSIHLYHPCYAAWKC